MEGGTQELPVGEVGELVLRGPQVMKGYWTKREEPEAVLRDGWLYTCVIARMAHDGFFFIVVRQKPMSILFPYTTLFRSHFKPIEDRSPYYSTNVGIHSRAVTT